MTLLIFQQTTALLGATAESSDDPLGASSAALKAVFTWLAHFGIWGTLAAVLIIAWWQWPKIKELPGVAPLVTLLKDRIVKGKRLVVSTTGNTARGDRLSIAVARLINDNEGSDSKTLVLEELKTFAGIEVLDVDSEIDDVDVTTGHARARDMLSKRRADAIIWGRVVKFDGHSVPKLYLTYGADDALNKVDHYKPTEDLKLPELFWDNLKQVLGLVVATAHAKVAALRGQYTADKLMPHVGRVQTLLASGETWTAQQRAPIESLLASALLSLGEQTGDNEYLRQSIAAYRRALQEHTHERVPLEWAATQNNLGVALSTLGERESGTARLEEAVSAYREALQEYTRERALRDWVMTQNNLANALELLGARHLETQDNL